MSDAEDQRLIETYRAAGGELPPPALDRAILESARQAAAGSRQGAQPGALHRSRWMRPLALAATVVLGLGIVIRVQMERPDLAPQAVRTQAGALPTPLPAEATSPKTVAPELPRPAPGKLEPADPPESIHPAPARDSYAESLKLKKAPALDQAIKPAEEAARRESRSQAEAAAGKQAGTKRDQPGSGQPASAGADFGFRGIENRATPQPAPDKAADAAPEAAAGAAVGGTASGSFRAPMQRDSAPPGAAATEMAPSLAVPAPLAAPAPPPAPAAMAAPPDTARRAAAPPVQMAPPPPPPQTMAAPSFAAPARPMAPAQPAGSADAKVAAAAAAADVAPPSAPLAARAKVAGSVRPLDESNPDAWARRIGDLRRAGRQLDADLELKRLRARYPDFKVPAEALPPPPASPPPAP
jgi:hypothetical protein